MKKRISLLCAIVLMALATFASAETSTATAKGFAGDVTVTITVEDGKITSAAAEGASETVGVGSVALEKLPAAMVAKNTITVDALSGATFTSNAVIEAATVALGSMGIKAEDLVPVETATAEAAEDVYADVLVVGGGGAGLAASLSASEAGMKVVLLEKTAVLGGNTAISGNVFTRCYKEGDPDYIMSEEELYDYLTMMTEGLADPEVTRTYVENCVDTQTWAFSRGSGVQETTKFHTNPESLMGVQALPRGALPAVMAEELAETATDIRMNTTATDLIVENGRVVGAIAINEDGQEQKFFGKGGVILACGGFPGSEDLLKKYSSAGAEKAGLYCNKSSTGDGIVMAEKVGAAIRFGEDWDSIGTSMCTNASKPDDLLPAMIINTKGVRFISENGQLPHIYKEMLHEIADGSTGFFYVFDANTVGENTEQYIADGAIVADTLEELAEKMGVPVDAFVAQANSYNAEMGKEDSQFGKESEYMKGLGKAPFYAFAGWPFRTSTIGGVVINKDAQVLDENNEVIPGLYSAGEMANYSFFHAVYPTCGSAVGHAIIFGRIAGTNAAAELK